MISKSEIPEPGNWCVGDVAEVVTGNTPSREVERFSRGAVGRVLLRPETSEPGISGDSGTSFRHFQALRPGKRRIQRSWLAEKRRNRVD